MLARLDQLEKLEEALDELYTQILRKRNDYRYSFSISKTSRSRTARRRIDGHVRLKHVRT
jgi:hypothetical protein